MEMIKVQNLSKTYKKGTENAVHALNDVAFDVKESSIMAIVGPSGSGKSTLLNILGGLDRQYEGHAFVKDKDIKKYNANTYRRKIVQTIFQQFYLVPSLTVYENITLPNNFGRQFGPRKVKERAEYILDKVGLSNRKNHKPKELSGGQAQRVAIARALMPDPQILLADEPTGNLDTKTGTAIMDLLMKINQESKTTIAIITHDVHLIKDIDEKIYIQDGKIVKDLEY